MKRTNPKSSVLIALTIVLTATAPFAVAADRIAQDAQLLVVVVLDRSSSMGGERFDVSRREILAKAKQIPPTPATRWVIVPFDMSPHRVTGFQSGVKELEDYLDSLTAHGGTDIASGLSKGIDVVERFGGAAHVLVFLYTDDEDGDRQSIEAQEGRLDQLFQRRKSEGLGQLVVCRRWGSANANLLARLQEGGNVPVIDAGEANLLHTTFEPQLDVQNVSWNDKRQLEVELTVQILVKGHPLPEKSPPLTITCVTPKVEGDRAIEVLPAAPPLTVRLVIPPEVALSSNPFPLEFEVSAPPATTPAEAGVRVITLARDRSTVLLNIPPLERVLRLRAQLTPRGSPRWLDPLRWRFAQPVEITVEMIDDLPLAFSSPVQLVIDPETGYTWAEGETSIEFAKPGMKSIPATIALAAQQSVPLSITLRPGAWPPTLTAHPPTLDATCQVSTPPPLVTNIRPVSVGAEQGAWIDPAGVALFQAEIPIDVGGPVPEQATLTLESPPAGVLQAQLAPHTLNTGRQALQLRFLARVAPNSSQQFDFACAKLPPQGAVQPVLNEPLRVTARGLSPLRVGLAHRGQVRSTIRLPLPEGAQEARIPLMPVVAGVAHPSIADRLSLKIRPSGGIDVQTTEPLHTFQSASVRVRPAGDLPTAGYFFDSHVNGRIDLQTNPSSAVVQTHPCEVVLWREAPFKRLLIVLLIALFIALTVWYPWRTLRRLSEVGSEWESDGASF